MDRNFESMVVVEDDSDEQYDSSNQTKTHYILRNVFDLTALSILKAVRVSIENKCDESTLVRYALDAFKEQIDRINHTLSTATEHS